MRSGSNALLSRKRRRRGVPGRVELGDDHLPGPHDGIVVVHASEQVDDGAADERRGERDSGDGERAHRSRVAGSGRHAFSRENGYEVASAGSVSVTLVPSGPDARRSSPCISSASSCAIASPRPLPDARLPSTR